MSRNAKVLGSITGTRKENKISYTCYLFCVPSSILLHGKEIVMAGILATILDQEDKDNTLEMVEWLEGACVPKE